MAKVTFIESTHKYFLDDGETLKELISVTTLMGKHGLAPSYEGVDPEVLQAKAKRGTLVHKEIEDYCVNGDIGFTPEFSNFVDYVDTHNLKVLSNELLVNNDMVAGTIDLVLENNTIADIKTTAVLHLDSVSWQLSIYAYLYNLTHDYKLVNGKVFHFNSLGELDVRDIPLKPQWMVEKLLKCEANGELFTYDLDYNKNKLERIYAIENYIKEVNLAQKKAELEVDMLKAELLVAMQNQNCEMFQTDNIKITRVDAYEKTVLDYDKLKREITNLYDIYGKVVTVDPTVKITIKNNKKKEKKRLC